MIAFKNKISPKLKNPFLIGLHFIFLVLLVKLYFYVPCIIGTGPCGNKFYTPGPDLNIFIDYELPEMWMPYYRNTLYFTPDYEIKLYSYDHLMGPSGTTNGAMIRIEREKKDKNTTLKEVVPSHSRGYTNLVTEEVTVNNMPAVTTYACGEGCFYAYDIDVGRYYWNIYMECADCGHTKEEFNQSEYSKIMEDFVNSIRFNKFFKFLWTI